MILKELIHPYKINEPLIHLGNKGDGGYVLPRSALSCEVLYSYGIGDNISFETDWEKNTGRKSYLYDMTVDSPVLLPNMKFFKEGISGQKQLTTDNFLNHLVVNQDAATNILLKIDVEGAEYDWIAHTDMAVLAARVYCLTIEFHWIGGYKQQFVAAIEKLQESFDIVHLHGNNYNGLVEGAPDVPEMTFTRKTANLIVAPCKYCYPLKDIDYPNNFRHPDLVIDYSD